MVYYTRIEFECNRMKNSIDNPVISHRVQDMKEYFFLIANKRIKAVSESGIAVINLGIGSPDLAPPEAVKETLAKHVLENSNYGYPSYQGLPALLNEISNWYKREYSLSLDISNIQPMAGSKEAIFFITMALVNKDDVVLVPDPGYPTYTSAVQLIEAKFQKYSLKLQNHFLPDLKEMENQDLSKVKMMWINYPNNPTGAVASIEDYRRILDFTRKHGIVLVSDNPYSHVTFDSLRVPSLLEVAEKDDLVIEVDSLSKTYNLAGLRLAWAVGNQELMSALKSVYSNIETGIFTAIQKAAIKALQTPTEWIEDRNKVYEGRTKIALQLCEALGLKAIPPKGALYVWAQIPKDQLSSEKYCFALLERTGVFITPGTAFGDQGEGFVRISLCQPESVFLEAIERINK